MKQLIGALAATSDSRASVFTECSYGAESGTKKNTPPEFWLVEEKSSGSKAVDFHSRI